ncbi:MarR family winged helix-turn-helix transcriptional regulator [Paraburkholderia sp. C35]|uniref:MarR family winged helix-turn-helix transcriptional regulator n=1 Tax=Paraburkholderia sp. C35 TaxID=2126993 RepID=UPI000D694BFC|nr:MarR family winged helix-turn-helix transcriptional regulator [Paraburkholderia sp. C35]
MDESKDLDEVCNCSALRKATRYLTAVYDQALEPTGLKSTQFIVLSKISRLGGSSVKRLAALMAMDRTTLAANFKPLERDGFLKICPGEDKREKIVQITEKGLTLLTEATPLWASAQSSFESRFGVGNAEDMRTKLRRVLNMGFDPWAE